MDVTEPALSGFDPGDAVRAYGLRSHWSMEQLLWSVTETHAARCTDKALQWAGCQH